MIKFNRGKCPACLSHKNKDGQANYEKWNKNWVKKVNKNPTIGNFPWHVYQKKRVNELIIEALRTMSYSHCAFCDKYAPENDSDSIEHFYPKKIYPEKAFNWDNLFLSCNGCQKTPKNWKSQEHKRNLILKPDEEAYLFNRYFIFNTKNGNIEVNHWNNSDLDKKRAEITIIYFQLNEFKRPIVRLHNFRNNYDARQPNKISKNVVLPLNKLPYRFIYL